MSVLHVEYDMEVRYAQPVVKSFFTIKCTPAEVQTTSEVAYVLAEQTTSEVVSVSYNTGTDSFGNKQIYGSILVPHNSFRFHMAGDVEVKATPEVACVSDVTRIGIYRYPHGKCIPWTDAEVFLRELPLARCASEYDRCMVILKALNGRLCYVKNATTVYTTAQQAWEKGCGVCQDFAHIYITLLRMAGIPARYVCGLVVGEGESHAWVEALCGGKWVALDPTQGSVISDQYIKLGHGRDASDCAINRGIIWGGGAQRQLVRARVIQQ